MTEEHLRDNYKNVKIIQMWWEQGSSLYNYKQ